MPSSYFPRFSVHRVFRGSLENSLRVFRVFRGSFAVVGLYVFVVSASAAAEPGDMEAKLNTATAQLTAALERNPPVEGKELTITVAPLIDTSAPRLRKIGMRGADIITRRLHERHPPWLRVLDRVALPKLVQQDRSWITQTVRQSHMGDEAPGGLFEQATWLVIGTVAPAGDAVDVELRVVNPIKTTIIATASCRITLTQDEKTEWLKFVEHGGPASGADDVAPVTRIDLKLTAQRADGPGAVKEWPVRNGELLRGGDQFNIRFIPDADACVYIFMHGSDGKTALLYPLGGPMASPAVWRPGRSATEDNYCRAEEECVVPDRENFFRLDHTPGRNTLFVVAHRSDVRAVEKIRQRLEECRTDEERSRYLNDRGLFDYVMPPFVLDQQ